MAETQGRKPRGHEAPLDMNLAEIAGENVLARFREDLRNIGADLEIVESRVGGWGPLPLSRAAFPRWSRTMWRPVDLEETPTDYRVRVDLPGVRKEEATIRFLDQDLEIRVEAKSAVEGERRNFVFRERLETSSVRRIPFPTPVIPENAEARLEEGVLTVTVPKQVPSQELKVELQ